MSEKPLLFLDVDGVFNPEARSTGRLLPGYTTHRMRPRGWDDERRKPLPVRLNADHGPLLLGLPYELVWATSWEHDANTWISPHLGIPKLPVVQFTIEESQRYPRRNAVLWKTYDVIEYAAGRDFAWLDDQTSAQDGIHIMRHHPGQFNLLHIDPWKGFTEEHARKLHLWAAELRSDHPSSYE